MADHDYGAHLRRHDETLQHLARVTDNLTGFVAQQMVMNARLERRHEEHEARFALHEATGADQETRLARHEARLAQNETILAEMRALTRAQEAHNQALYEMHAELRLAFVTLDTRLGRIEALLGRAFPDAPNGRDA